jgi:phage gpG-like protein
MSAGAMITTAQINASVGQLRFDKSITGFEFKPSIGIVAKQMNQLGLAIADMKVPLTKAVKDVMIPSIRKNFTSGGRPEWEELSTDTVRKRNGSSRPILVRSGALASGATSFGIWSVGSVSATVRDLPKNIWYGKVHQGGSSSNNLGAGNWFGKYRRAAEKQLGSDAPESEILKTAYELFDMRLKKHGPAPAATAEIPARPFIMFQDEDLDDIQDIFFEWLGDLARSVGKFS